MQDLTAVELVGPIERAGRPDLRSTLDNVNLGRLGEDMLEGTPVAAPLTRLVQLRDHLPTRDPGDAGRTGLRDHVPPS